MNPRHVGILVRMEATQRYRAFFGQTRRVTALIIAGVFLLVPLAVVGFARYAAGTAVAGGDLSTPRWAVRAIGGGAVGGVALMSTIRAVQTAAVPENADGVLSIAGHREVVASVLIVEMFVVGTFVGVPGLLAAAAFAAGAGSILAGTSVLVAVACVLVLGTSVGLVLGFGIRIAIARSELLARYKTAIGVLLLLGYLLALTASGGEGTNSAFATAGKALGATPLGWFGDLALAGAGIDTHSALAGGALLLTAGGVLFSGILISRLAAFLWYEEAVEGTHDEPESTGMGDLGGVPRPVERVARKSWLRAWRSPIRLLYVVYPLFVLIGPLSEALRTGTVPPYLPAFVALYGGWATGAAFTLNPIGDETDVLSVTLTTPIEGRTFMAGCCLAGLLIGVPLTALGAVATAIAAGAGLLTTAATAILGITVPVGATTLATGIGTTFPRLEAVNVTRGRKAVVPSLFGFAVYSLLLTSLASPGLLVGHADTRRAVSDAAGLGIPVTLIAGLELTLLLLGSAGYLSFRRAARSFDEYYLE